MKLQENINRIKQVMGVINEGLHDNNNLLLNESIDRSFKNKILSSLKEKLGGYGKLPKEIKDSVKFNQIPMDVYQKINDYYEFEKTLPGNTYMEFCKRKLSSIGKGVDELLLGFLGFIELIGTDKFDKYDTNDLYNGMVDEIRNIPDIKNSDDPMRDYNIFRKTLVEKYSPTRNLQLVITSRFQYEYYRYNKLIERLQNK
jgi:hypothetical protein